MKKNTIIEDLKEQERTLNELTKQLVFSYKVNIKSKNKAILTLYKKMKI